MIQAESPSPPPARSAARVNAEALDDQQAGHLRRMLDLAERLPDDWSGMMGRSSLQEDFGALRFQLAYMAYALALTHVHRLPAAPAVFRAPFDRLIQKMLSHDVWTYWHYVSTGNGPFNKALGELPAEWNPVVKDNIMYSAYVQSTSLLYHHLFDDPKYAQPGALSFKLQPLFWGNGGETFAYDEKSLNEHIYWQMVEKGYLGIACEPNCVFQICNQPAILAFRLHDILYGGATATEVTEGYRRAWAEFGIVDELGHFNIVVQEREHALVERPPLAWGDFWLGSLMHAWNPDLVKASYPAQIAHWIRPGPDGTAWIEPSIPPSGFGRELTHAWDFGWAAVCASEVGDADHLGRMLGYADRCLTPTWEDGAFYYRRRDGWFDDARMLHAMDPHTGNVLLGYARLNVPDGLHKLYAAPWTAEHFAEPALIGMSDGLDVRAARYDADSRTLSLAFRKGRCRGEAINLTLANIWDRGCWTAFVDGEVAAEGDDDAVTRAGQIAARRIDDTLALAVPPRAQTLDIRWAAL